MVSQAGAAVGFCAAKLAISEPNLGGESENADPHGISSTSPFLTGTS